MRKRLSQAELESYLDEDLAPEQMAEIETALRDDPKLVDVLSMLNGRRDSGVHSLGAIWRHNRISCLTREQLGSYLLDALDVDLSAYIAFHVERIGCRVCRANLEDLKRQQEESNEVTADRRDKYFQSSAGYLRRKQTHRRRTSP